MEQKNQQTLTPVPVPFYKRTFIRSIFVMGLVFCAYGFGFLTSYQYFPQKIVYTGIANQEKGKPEKIDFSMFWDAWNLIQSKYVDRNNLNYQAMVLGSVDGLVNSLHDPYTVFFDSTSSKQFKETIQGSFEGIGAEIDVKNGVPVIVAPLKDTPAEKAGLKPEDKILKVDDKSTEGLALDEVVAMIRGPRGSIVKLTILRGDSKESIVIPIARSTIKIPVIHYELKDGVNYVQIYQFSETLPAEFSITVEKILNSGSDKIILDLRNNPGGFLETAVDVASYFISRDKTVVIEDYGNGKKDTFNSNGYELLADYKVVVLVNGGSASASEILAGALRDQKGIKLIGEKTFGKGSVQELESLRENTSLKITVAHWLTPNNHMISDVGLEPDINVQISDQDKEQKKDPQLDKAIEAIKGM
jgi:carboxyl-terminal processing protease